jgi:RNA polymerase-interacting CarD/CdnL/TRCF family regulator
MLIPLLIGWKNIFKDLETWHIFTTIIVSQNYEVLKMMKLKNLKVSNRQDYLNIHSMEKINTGINAMSISTLTGIPRATVIRKLNKLMKSKNLSIDHRKLYTVNIKNIKNNYLNTQTIENTKRISTFLTKILNLVITSK